MINLEIKVLKALLRKNGSCEIHVKGRSMEPLLKEGDIVVIEETNNYTISDIVVFYYNKIIIIHRVMDIIGNIMICKGDNAMNYERVRKENVIGRVKNKLE